MAPENIAVVDDTATLAWLAGVIDNAIVNDRKVSFTVEGGLKVKLGESMWTAPLGRTLAPVCSHCGSVLVNEDCPNYGSGEYHA